MIRFIAYLWLAATGWSRMLDEEGAYSEYEVEHVAVIEESICLPQTQFSASEYLLASDARLRRRPRPVLMTIGTQFGTRYPYSAEAIRRWRPFALGDELGSAVALDGSIMAAAAFADTRRDGFQVGAVYTYVSLDGGKKWVETSKIVPSDSSRLMFFGHKVGVSGNELFATTRTSNGGRELVGALYVFQTTDGGYTWTETQKLVPSIGNGLFFGESLSVSQDFIVVGAPLASSRTNPVPGQALVFGRQGGKWVQIACLVPSDARKKSSFGWSVAVQGTTIIVGAIEDSPDGVYNAGSAYVFKTDDGGTTWREVQKLIASDKQKSDWFGYSVAMGDGIVMIGMVNNHEPKNREGVYVFCSGDNGFEWRLVQILRPRDASRGQGFGRSISLYRTTAVVGAVDDGYYSPGAAYVYSTCNNNCSTSWSETQKLVSPNPSINQQFGHSVAIQHNSLIIGALADGVPGNYWGAVFTFVDS